MHLLSAVLRKKFTEIFKKCLMTQKFKFSIAEIVIVRRSTSLLIDYEGSRNDIDQIKMPIFIKTKEYDAEPVLSLFWVMQSLN